MFNKRVQNCVTRLGLLLTLSSVSLVHSPSKPLSLLPSWTTWPNHPPILSLSLLPLFHNREPQNLTFLASPPNPSLISNLHLHIFCNYLHILHLHMFTGLILPATIITYSLVTHNPFSVSIVISTPWSGFIFRIKRKFFIQVESWKLNCMRSHLRSFIFFWS